MVSANTAYTFKYLNYAFFVGARQTSNKKTLYFLDGVSGVTTLVENADLTITNIDKTVTISSSNGTAIHCILFMA